ncbi:MAG: hypothetical protein ACYTXY_06555 [Nostoc sp.]
MTNTSLLRLRQRLLYETLRERYFDPSLRDATRTTGVTLSLSKGSGQASSVQVSRTILDCERVIAIQFG